MCSFVSEVFFEIRHFGRDDETGLPIGHTVWIWRDHSDTLKCDATTVSEISACSERTFDKSLGVVCHVVCPLCST